MIHFRVCILLFLAAAMSGCGSSSDSDGSSSPVTPEALLRNLLLADDFWSCQGVDGDGDPDNFDLTFESDGSGTLAGMAFGWTVVDGTTVDVVFPATDNDPGQQFQVTDVIFTNVFRANDRFVGVDSRDASTRTCDLMQGTPSMGEVTTDGGDMLTLMQRINTGQDMDNNSSPWVCGDASYAFWSDGNGERRSGDVSESYVYDVDEDIGSVVANGFATLAWNNLQFSTADAFSATDLVASEIINCAR